MKIKLSIAALFTVTTLVMADGEKISVFEVPKEDELNSFIKTMNGYIRVGYQYTDLSANTNYVDTSIGGKLHVETISWNSISAGASFYTTNVIGQDDGNGVPFFDANNNSYSILGEAYLKGEWGNTMLKVGRQEIDTPFADTDDIGMVPNTFEAAVLVNTDIENTTIVLAQVQKMAGVDALIPEKFTEINGNNGVQAIGVIFEGIEGLSLSGWYYHADDIVKLPYIEAVYETAMDGVSVEIGAQYAYQDWEGSEAAKVSGASISAGFESTGLTFGTAYNKSSGAQADNLFGGGPFFTSAEHLTIAEAGPDGDALKLSAEWNAGTVGLDALSFGANYLMLEDNRGAEATEFDLVVSYAFNNALKTDIIYSDINDFSSESKNLRVFLNYLF